MHPTLIYQRVKETLLPCPKMPLALLGGVFIAGCVAVTQPLWRIDQAASGCSHAFDAIVNSAGDIYQTCSPTVADAEGWVRKLSSDAEEQWRHPLNFQSQESEISEADGSVVLFHDNNQATWINADGTERWNREVVPQGSIIVTHSRVANGRLYMIHAAPNSRKMDGIVALDTSGNELWSYQFNENGMIPTLPELAVLESGELIVKLTLLDQDFAGARGDLLVFDINGNATQQRTVAKYAQLIDNRKTAYLMEHYTISKLDVSGHSQWSHELFPWEESSYEYPMAIPCAGDGEEEMACGFAGAITWLTGNGEVVKRYGITDIQRLTYNGDHKWTVTRRTERSVPSALTTKTETFNSLFVITDQGAVEQKFYLKPIVETNYFCKENPITYTCTKYSVGDQVLKTFAAADKVFAVGNTTYGLSSFVAAFSAGAQ